MDVSSTFQLNSTLVGGVMVTKSCFILGVVVGVKLGWVGTKVAVTLGCKKTGFGVLRAQEGSIATKRIKIFVPKMIR